MGEDERTQISDQELEKIAEKLAKVGFVVVVLMPNNPPPTFTAEKTATIQ